MSQESIYVGIDVSKERIDVAVRPTGRNWSVSYDGASVDDLVTQLKDLKPAGVITESTGDLELPLVAALAAASLPVAVVNPRQVRDFAKSTGQLAKTDRLDAHVLAHFGEAVRPAIRPLRDADTRALGAMLARRRQVSGILVAEKNRLGRATPEVRPRLEAHISWLQQELDDLDTDLRQRIQHSPVWREKDDLLRSVPGVGPPSVADTARVSAGTGHAEPQADRRPGRCGAFQSGQRSSSRQAVRVGRSSYGALYAVYGRTGGQSVQPGATRLLPAIARSRQAEESGSHCLRAEATDNPQHYGKDGCSLGSDHSQALTLKTVAIPLAVSTDTYAAQWRQVVQLRVCLISLLRTAVETIDTALS